MIVYVEEDALDPIFSFVAERYGRAEEVPVYRSDTQGMAKLCGVLERAKMDTYYPSLSDKAVHLLVGINKGHFFGNGNKRLALVVMTVFLALNGQRLKEKTKESYQILLSGLFPEGNNWVDYTDFSATDFAMYNLSIIIADSGARGVEHDSLKQRVLTFLNDSIESILQ